MRRGLEEVEIDGAKFLIRAPQQADVIQVFGRIPVMGAGEGEAVSSTAKAAAEHLARGRDLLLLCVKRPKLILEWAEELPENTLPIEELTTAQWNGLVDLLLVKGGLTTEAAAAVRPSSGTVANS